MKQLDMLRRHYSGYAPSMLDARHRYAVLCPLVEQADALHVLFEVRAAGLRRQPGEVCFPGGMQEPGESPIACALRETREELSIPACEIDLLGTPDFLCSHRNFLLQPVLGVVSPAGLAALRPSPAEVAEVFTVPLPFFQENLPQVYRYDLLPTQPAAFPYEAVGVPADYRWASGSVEVPVWFWEGHAIWGMTARILRNILQTL